MSKFNIVSKKPAGMEPGKDYIVEYQLYNKPEIYQVKMYCIGGYDKNSLKKLVFIEGNYEGIKSNIEKETFLKELKEFQKGASYRRSHPIALSEKQKIQNEIDKLQKQLDSIEKKENDKLVEEFITTIASQEELLEVERHLEAIFNNARYTIKDYSFDSLFGRAVIYDKFLKVPVKVIFFNLNEFRDLTYEETVNVMKKRKSK